MPKRNRSKIQQEIKERLKYITNPRRLLPMPYESNITTRKISIREWEEFHQRKMLYQQAVPDYESKAGQPLPSTVKDVWDLLTPYFSGAQEQFNSLPASKNWMTEGEKQKCRQATETALVIELDTFVNAGLVHGTITYNNVFDVLCRKFSDHHRMNLANSVRDMKKDTARHCRRDLLLNGININKLWDLVVGEWSQLDLNPLFHVRKLRYSGKGQLTRIFLKDSTVLAEFQTIVDADPQYTRAHTAGITALFADAEPPKRHPRRKVCAEEPYNEVILKEKSEELLRLQSKSLLLLNVDAFKNDYEAARSHVEDLSGRLKAEYGVDPELPSTKRHRRENGHEIEIWSYREKCVFYRAIEKGLGQIDYDQQVIAGAQSAIERGREKWDRHRETFLKWRQGSQDEEVRQQASPSVEEVAKAAEATREWRQKVRKLLADYDRAQGHVYEYSRVWEQVKGKHGLLPIRCVFDRIINRRYQSLHFWPTYVSSKNIDLENEEDSGTCSHSEEKLGAYRKRWFKARNPGTGKPCALVGLDISSSQTQIIATLLGVEKLENLTMGHTGRSFKKVMAKWTWQKHRDPKDEFYLNKGSSVVPDYEGPEDPRLERLCKEVWMRTSYGGYLPNTVRDQRSDPKTYGPGWTTPNANCFLEYLYSRFPEVKRFLEACGRIAELACKHDPCAGVTFTDPSDGVVVRWNPIARGDVKVPNGGHKLILSVPGKDKVVEKDGKKRKEFEEFAPNNKGEYPVDSERLQRMIAPCLVQMLDAYYSTLVMEKLAKRGITDFVGIHDCWLIPEKVSVGGMICDGDDVLRKVMVEAAGEWYAGLGTIYKDLLRYLGPDQKFGNFIRATRKKWQERVKEGYKPVFLAKSE